MEALKPCPFCGSSRVDSHFVRDGRRIACGCGAGMTRHHGKSGDTEGDVRAAWNTRSDHSPALLEALKEAQSVLAMMVEPGAIQQTTVINAYAAAKAAEAKARSALSQAFGHGANDQGEASNSCGGKPGRICAECDGKCAHAQALGGE